MWQRLNGKEGNLEEELLALQRESKALLGLRTEATKLRAGIRLLQKQKELKRAMLIRYASEHLLEETLRADLSIMRLQKELSLKAALLEMERIFLVLESELRSTSTLTDRLLPMVERYGTVCGAKEMRRDRKACPLTPTPNNPPSLPQVEQDLRRMAALVQKDLHAAVDEERLHRLESEIGDFVLQLGLQGGNPDQESFSCARSREMIAVSMSKVGAGLSFTAKGVQLFFQANIEPFPRQHPAS